MSSRTNVPWKYNFCTKNGFQNHARELNIQNLLNIECCQIKAMKSEYFCYLATSFLSSIPISCFLNDWLLFGYFLEVCTIYAIYSLPKRKKMAESTNFSTSLKGLSKAAYFIIFRTAVTEGTFRVLLESVFLHSSSHQGQRREHGNISVPLWITSQAPRAKRFGFGVLIQPFTSYVTFV